MILYRNKRLSLNIHLQLLILQESIAWDPHQPHLLSAASEDGTVTCWDVRKFETAKPYWSFVAHEYGGCSDISYNP